MIPLPVRTTERPAPYRPSRWARLTGWVRGTGRPRLAGFVRVANRGRVTDLVRGAGQAWHPDWARHPGWARLTAVAGRHWLALAAGGSAVFAGVTALISVNQPERLWGVCGVIAYPVATVAVLLVRRWGEAVAVGISLVGALLVPLGWMLKAGLAQPEVGVVSRSAAMFLHRGTPYEGLSALAAAHSVNAYDPYLPALIMFGIPRTLLGGGPLTDPRVWFGLVFAAAFVTAAALAGARRPVWCTAVVAVSPVVALPLTVGGDDLPVLGLMCLGLAVACRDDLGRLRPVAAGLVMGLAAAMKATAWPALVIVGVLVAARHGRRGVVPFVLAALGVAVAADGATLAAHPDAAWVNTVLFPLGLAKMKSPAASSLPGHLIASAWSGGHAVDLLLIAAAGLALGLWLIRRPPRSIQAAGWRLVLGLTILFLLAPASRVGYFTYPFGLAAWLLMLRAGTEPLPAQAPAAGAAEAVQASAAQAARGAAAQAAAARAPDLGGVMMWRARRGSDSRDGR